MFNNQINISKFNLSNTSPVFIIAEIGVNHNGDIELAKKLIHEAACSGADCVKFQTFKADRVVTKYSPKSNYQLKTTPPDESQLDMLRRLELSFNHYEEIIDYCTQKEIVFMSTPYNIEDVDFLDRLNVPAYKLASIHVVEPYLIKYTAQKGKPILLSTGMSTLSEVENAVSSVKETENNDLILLQCTTNYPSKNEDTNLLSMRTMAEEFKILVGYSDHTLGDTACIVSVALGAKVIEKHFTIDKTLPGPDQSTSVDPKEFSNLVKKIRDTESILGSSKKMPCEAEKENSYGMRRSIVAKRVIKIGDVITENMLIFKRPSSGLSPIFFNEIIGKTAKTDIQADTLIEWSDINY